MDKKAATCPTEQELLSRISEGGESGEKAFEALIDMHKGFVRKTAGGYANRGIPFEELEQAGYVGLIKAVKKYNASRGCRLLTYAGKMIKGEIVRLFKERYGLPKTYSLDDALSIEEDGHRGLQSETDNDETFGRMNGAIDAYLRSLDETSARVVRSFFGFDGPASSIAGIAGLLGVEKERVRQILFTALRSLLKPGRSQAMDRFIKGYSIDAVVIRYDRFEVLTGEIAQEIWRVSAGSFTLCYKELIYLLHFFDPVSDLTEEFHAGWNRRAEYYTRCVCETFDSEKSLANPAVLVSWLYHASLYVIIDVFGKIAERCVAEGSRPIHSLLVHVFWQDIVCSRIYRPLLSICEGEDLQGQFMHFYFAYFGTLFKPAGLTTTDADGNLHLGYSKVLLLFLSCVKREAIGKKPFVGYSMTTFFGPVVTGLENELSRIAGNVFKTSLSRRERNELLWLAYYFQRVFPYLSIDENSPGPRPSVTDVPRTRSVSLGNKQTMFRLGYQAGLRKLLLGALEKHGNQLRDGERLNRFICENRAFFDTLKHRIRIEASADSRMKNCGDGLSRRLSFYIANKNTIKALLDFLQVNGGLNLLQLSGFRVLVTAGIDFPLGYITGER